MGGLLLAADYHWTLANERNGEFTVNADVLNAITNFINLGNSFAVVTNAVVKPLTFLALVILSLISVAPCLSNHVEYIQGRDSRFS